MLKLNLAMILLTLIALALIIALIVIYKLDLTSITPMVTTLTLIWTIFIYRNDKKLAELKELGSRLFMIQNLAFSNPFLEDKTFTKTWNEIKKDEANEKVLQYDLYCEMIFNHLEQCYHFYGTASKMQQHCNYKDWVRTHKLWWQSPLEEHSNGDSYPKKFREIIDDWIK